MSRFFGSSFAALCALALVAPAQADEKAAHAILDKAIKALGGEEKLGKIKAATWKTKGTITLMGSDNEFSTQSTIRGLDYSRQEFEGDFGGNKVMGVTVVANDKGWRKFGENSMVLDKDGIANQKRGIYLSVIPVTILPLKSKEFKVDTAAEEKVGDKPAVGVKATGPDGKEFTIYFDKESGLPVKTVAKVTGFMGEEFTLATTFSDYKDMGGIKKATKLDATRDGEQFQNVQVTEFKPLDKVEDKTFAEPE